MISEKEMNGLPLPQLLKRFKIARIKKVQIPFSIPILERIFRYIGDQKEITADYTLSPDDANAVILSLDTTNKVITIDPKNSIPDLSFVDVEKHGTGTVTIQVPVGVTLNGTDNGSAVLNDDYAGVRLRRINKNTFTLIGNFA